MMAMVCTYVWLSFTFVIKETSWQNWLDETWNEQASLAQAKKKKVFRHIIIENNISAWGLFLLEVSSSSSSVAVSEP